MADNEQKPQQYSYQTDEQFVKIVEELTQSKQRVVEIRDWYKKHAPSQAVFFRFTGVLLIMLSVSVPFIAAQTAPWKDGILSVMSLLIAALSGLTAFFRWEYSWQSFRQTQYTLNRMMDVWDFRMIEARHQADPQTAINIAFRATEQLLNDAAIISGTESAEFFKRVQPPQTAK